MCGKENKFKLQDRKKKPSGETNVVPSTVSVVVGRLPEEQHVDQRRSIRNVRLVRARTMMRSWESPWFHSFCPYSKQNHEVW